MQNMNKYLWPFKEEDEYKEKKDEESEGKVEMTTKKANKENQAFINSLKSKVKKRRKEYEDSIISREEMYERMVEEAVLVIKGDWESKAKYLEGTKLMEDTIELTSNAFFITESGGLYSNNYGFVRNPKTKKCCFYNTFEFENEEEIKKYLNDVKCELPDGVEYDEDSYYSSLGEDARSFKFSIKITIGD